MDCRLYQKGIIFGLLAFGFWLFAVQDASGQQLTAKSPNWRDSLSVLNKAIASRPWSTDLHLRKAAVNLELQQWQYAIDEYSLVLQHEVNNPAALFYRGYAATRMRYYEAARNDYETFLGLFPNHAEARMAMSYVLQQLGRKTEALDELNIAVEIQPDSAVSYAARAALEQDLNQYDAALYDWQKAIELSPKNADFVASRVELLLRLRRKEEARRDLDAAVKRGIPRGLLHTYYNSIR